MGTIKRSPSGRGRGQVTQFPNIGTPHDFRMNQAIRFKFGKEMEDGPFLRTNHETTPKWAWLR